MQTVGPRPRYKEFILCLGYGRRTSTTSSGEAEAVYYWDYRNESVVVAG
jgi:hypothetical protein